VKSRVRDSDGKDRDGFAPVIEFRVNGAPVRFTGAVENFRQSNGNVVAVRYDPAQPSASARVVVACRSWRHGRSSCWVASRC
jgi:hypothetical protein